MRGKQVVLRAAEHSDLEMLWQWVNGTDTPQWLLVEPPVSRAEEQAWLERILSSTSEKMFIICTPDMTPVGTISLSRLNWKHRKASVGIAIWEAAFREHRLGTEAMELVLDYAFFAVGLHRVELDVFEDNARAVRSYEKCGFVKEGLVRECYHKDGRFINAVLMSVLDSDWRKRRGR